MAPFVVKVDKWDIKIKGVNKPKMLKWLLVNTLVFVSPTGQPASKTESRISTTVLGLGLVFILIYSKTKASENCIV